MNITTLQTFKTDFPADTIEWCPNVGYKAYFACGTYYLDEDSTDTSTPPSRRKGSVYLFKFDLEKREFTEIFRHDTAAVLDMKWLPPRGIIDSGSMQATPILATADALGQVDVYILKSDRLELRASLHLNLDTSHILALSLDWNWPAQDEKSAIQTRYLLASDSRGDVSMLEFTIDDEAASYSLEKAKVLHAHNFEAWICAFDKWDSNIIYTGGDDLVVHVYDLRNNERIFTNRSHSAGVTCLLSHPKRERMLLTGSYDEKLRIFDTRSMQQPLGVINLNGGIWRLKPDPLDKDLILAACMYKNFSIVRLPPPGSEEYSPILVGVYNEHESICYGADWCLNIDQDDERNKNLYMATCSFYDHKLCISSVE